MTIGDSQSHSKDLAVAATDIYRPPEGETWLITYAWRENVGVAFNITDGVDRFDSLIAGTVFTGRFFIDHDVWLEVNNTAGLPHGYCVSIIVFN